MKRVIWRATAVQAAAYLLAAAVLTWPLAGQITEAIPLGSETAPTVPLFNFWTLGWNVDRLQHGYQDYWDAPIFHPVPGAFAFSDPQPLTGLLAVPFWRVSPALAYNAVLLLFLMLNGLAASHLLRELGAASVPAFLSGLTVMVLPCLAYERGVLQLQPLFGVLLALAGLRRLTIRPDRRAALALGLGIGSTFLTSEYYALFLGLGLAAAVPFFAGPILRQKRSLPAVAAGPALALLLIIPLAWTQKASLKDMGFSRSAEAIGRGSAEPHEYVQIPHQLWSHEWLPLPDEGGQHLFPGLTLLVLALTGVAAGWRYDRMRRWTLFLVASAVVAFALSLGINLALGEWRPYELLRDHLPGFGDLRSPFRLAYFFQLYLALLAALALNAFWSWRRLAALALLGLLLLELWPRPSALTPVPEPINTASMTPPVIFLPYVDGRTAVAYAETAAWMAATIQAEPLALVNGYSGYFPRQNDRLKTLLADFPTTDGLLTLQALGVQIIVIRQDWPSPEQTARLTDFVSAGELDRIGTEQGLLLLRLNQAHLSQ